MKRTPVVFIHGAWLHALSWEPWVERFTGRGFRAVAPGWPGEAATVREVRAVPGGLAALGLDDLTEHYAGIVRSFDTAPVIVGHSVGGLVAQQLITSDIGRAAVAIAPVPVNDVPVNDVPVNDVPVNDVPAVPGEGLVTLTPEQFHHFVANTLTAAEAGRLHEAFAVPTSYRLLTDLGRPAGPLGPAAVADVGRSARGPLLLVSGQEDRLVPDAATRAVYKLYGDTAAVTDLKQFANRAHSLVIDDGWRSVADHVLGWLHEQGIRGGPAEH
ncbi:alpha/beta hydrolase [Streptomyces longispororuber]|uniref:alpha/beta hydrolase n=1 Tax=Streptomyces longispororuber TaxID=68230 RepID=UPI0021093029|nr:alpha/beta hydrolase [Streptomyces longispororuber]MCQ4205938.1 alpha/beta hydrolase [Streptomyces longispororuber]